ncbi:MAG: HAD-IB family phosphatase [Chitinophagaceae bacterium]|nr:HAD-IB family phosphatase [Chitinophagaceae bacterium]
MVSVILPALNEGATIRKVIQRIRQPEPVMEIIVVDDNSSDNTVSEALKENARVITSSRKGKGISMREGMIAATYDTIVYLDADIVTYPKNIVSMLADPILKGEADFVKSFFDRQAGRVTQLVAKPMLSIFFPELEKFTQPLSGMIAARKDFLTRVEFENDYGVDIALLIDAYSQEMRIQEVNIGYIKNDMQSLESLGKMSRQISRTILQRAASLSRNNLETLSDIHTISDEMDIAVKESILNLKKMMLIDISVVMEYDFNETAAAYYNQEEHYEWIKNKYKDPAARLQKTASLLKGKSLPELQSIADSIPLVEDAAEIISKLKKDGYLCVLVSEGFDVVANHIKNRLGFDYCLANHLPLEKSITSGELVIPEYFKRSDDPDGYDKSNVLLYATEKFSIPQKNTVYIGNSAQDIPMLKDAGMGLVTTHADAEASVWADKVLPTGSLRPLLPIVSGMDGEKRSLFTRKSAKYTALGVVALGAAFAGYYLYNKARRKSVSNCEEA